MTTKIRRGIHSPLWTPLCERQDEFATDFYRRFSKEEFYTVYIEDVVAHWYYENGADVFGNSKFMDFWDIP